MKKIKSKENRQLISPNNKYFKIKFDFCFFKFKSVKYKQFTNFVKDKDEAVEIINKLFIEFKIDILSQDLINQEHYHKIQERDKIECVEKIIELLNIIEIHNDEMKEYCQLGLTQGLRVICYKINNTLYPLFLDPHHLIYPNKKYNYKDFDKNKCCIFGNGD